MAAGVANTEQALQIVENLQGVPVLSSYTFPVVKRAIVVDELEHPSLGAFIHPQLQLSTRMPPCLVHPNL